MNRNRKINSSSEMKGYPKTTNIERERNFIEEMADFKKLKYQILGAMKTPDKKYRKNGLIIPNIRKLTQSSKFTSIHNFQRKQDGSIKLIRKRAEDNLRSKDMNQTEVHEPENITPSHTQ
jgi:hypothetical protein